MPRILLDTGPVIRHLRGHRASVQLLRALARRQRLAVSTVTRLEVFAGMHPDETYATRRLLSRFHTFSLDRQTGDAAGGLIAEYTGLSKLKLLQDDRIDPADLDLDFYISEADRQQAAARRYPLRRCERPDSRLATRPPQRSHRSRRAAATK